MILKDRWVDHIVQALDSLGGQAKLSAIYARVEELRLTAGIPLPKNPKAVIRGRLEDHCSDADGYKDGRDLFCMPKGKGAGFWALRESQAEQGHKEQQEFATEWPIGKLENITLDQYTNLDRETSFCYWIEAKTEHTGSIWGGSSYKFGIYRRKNAAKSSIKDNMLTDGEYSWYKKYGNNKEEAFEKVKSAVVSIAKDSIAGRFSSINKTDLGEAVKWKIAFLYNTKKLIPIFKREWMENEIKDNGHVDAGGKPISKLQEILLGLKPKEKTTLEYAQAIWSEFNSGNIFPIVKKFLRQAGTGNLKKKGFPKRFRKLDVKVSFGVGVSAKIPWIGFLVPPNTITDGIYPVYLYYKEINKLILAYGLSETNESSHAWVGLGDAQTINDWHVGEYGSKPFRYGDSFLKSVYDLDEELDSAELQSDLDEMLDLYTKIEFNDKTSLESTAQRDINYWLIAPGDAGSKWEDFSENGIVGLGWTAVEDLRDYESREAITEKLQEAYPAHRAVPSNNSLALWEFCHEMKAGDIVIAKHGRSKYLGYGEVTSDYGYVLSDKEYPHQRKIDWKKKGLWEADAHKIVLKTLTNITEYGEYVARLKRLIGIGEDMEYPEYTEEDALKEIFISPERLSATLKSLDYKKNIILQGPPGTGKTFMAKRLAYAAIGERDPSKVEMVQFHQSYSYEDFIQGFRPTESGAFELRNGVFYRFCNEAAAAPEKKHFFIIDEINRGNLSKIFGELMLLIEADKRGSGNSISLTYTGPDDKKFYIPDNVYLIGTMNTADRSLAVVDYALRRRFAFIDVVPNFKQKFKNHLLDNGIEESIIEDVITKIELLNLAISKDNNLGEGFQIGHSYFCNPEKSSEDADWYKFIIDHEIGPLLREYWFDKPDSVENHLANLRE
jgi:MoxR-like ATPase